MDETYRMISIPHVKAPKLTAPGLRAPKVTAPKVTAPKVTAPKVTAPGLEGPELTAPKLEGPSLEGAPEAYEGGEADPDQEIYSGDFDTDITYSDKPVNLDLEIGMHHLVISEGKADGIHLSGKNSGEIQCYVKDRTLYLKDSEAYKKNIHIDDRELILTIPSDIVWQEATLKAGLSSLEMETLNAREADLDAEMGSIRIGSVTAEDLEVSSSMGSVSIDSIQTDALEVSAEMGSAELSGIVNGNIEAESNMGSIELTLLQKESDFNYEVASGMGSVTVNGEKYTTDKEKKVRVNNDADKNMNLQSSMGSIDISFK